MMNFDKSKLLSKSDDELMSYLREDNKYTPLATKLAFQILLEREHKFNKEQNNYINSLLEKDSEILENLENQKLITENNKEINILSVLIYVLTVLSVIYIIYTLEKKKILSLLHPFFFIPSILIFVTAILIRIKYKYRYFVSGLIIPIVANYSIIAYFENVDFISNILFFLQIINWLSATIILFTYKKSPTS